MSDKQREEKRKRENAVNRLTGKEKNCTIDHDLYISIVLLVYALYASAKPCARFYCTQPNCLFLLLLFLSDYSGDSRKYKINACMFLSGCYSSMDRYISVCTDVFFSFL